jgi:hypothetical protein
VTDSGPANNASLLFDVGTSASVFSLAKTGTLLVGAAGGGATFQVNTSDGLARTFSTGGFAFTSSASADGTADVFLRRDAAGAVGQRNATSAQSYCAYNTYTDSSNWEKGCLDWQTSAGLLLIGAQKLGSGTSRQVRFVGGSFQFTTDSGGNLLQVTAGGNLTWNTDNASDIGASGATRPRNVYVGGFVSLAGDLVASNGTGITWATASILKGSANGALRWTKADNSIPTVAGLPTCNAGADGARSFVTDANASTFASTVAAGGANHVPVYCDGSASAWKIGALDLDRRAPANDNLPDGFVRAFG